MKGYVCIMYFTKKLIGVAHVSENRVPALEASPSLETLGYIARLS